MDKHALHHSRQRILERYGMTLSKKLKRAILLAIRQNATLFQMRVSNSRVIHVVKIEDRHFSVVYSKRGGCIITFLPLDFRQLEHPLEDPKHERQRLAIIEEIKA